MTVIGKRPFRRFRDLAGLEARAIACLLFGVRQRLIASGELCHRQRRIK